MKQWIFSIGATVLLVSIVSIILPNGKTGKFIKSIFSVLILLVTIRPLVSISKNNLNDGINFSNVDIEIQYDYINYIFEERKNTYEENCCKILEDIGVKNAKIDINYDSSSITFDVLFVNINLKDAVINSDMEHILVIEEIKEKTALYLTIDKSKLVIYE